MARIAGYIRVSTDKQDLQRQKLLIEKYCEKNSHELVRLIDEKISGAKTDRTGLNEVLELTNKDADIVIISELARLSREDDILDVMYEINAIRKNGLDLLILDTDTWIRTTDKIGGMQVMQLVFTAVGNAEERKKIADRMKTGRYAKLIKNPYAYIGGQVPFGFKVVPNKLYDEKVTFDREPKSLLEENKEEIGILEMMYGKIASGFTLHRLAKYMIDNGIIISNGNLANYQTLISDVLHNRLYIGERIYKGETFDIRPVIRKSLYDSAIAALEKNRWTVSYSSNYNPLKGLLFCTCGRSLYYTNCKNYKYYKCYKKKDDSGNQICKNSGVKAEAAFKAIWNAAKNMIVQEEFQIQTSEREAQLKQEWQIAYDALAKIQLDLIRKDKELSRITDTIAALDNVNLIKTFEKKYEDTEKEIEELKRRKSENGKTIMNLVKRIEELAKLEKDEKLDALSLEFKSEMLHKVIEKAIWCSDRLRKGFLQITYMNGLVETLLIQTDKTHSIILQLPTTIQLDLNQRKVRVDGEFYSFEKFLKTFDYSEWIIEETIVDGFKQRKSNHNETTNEELVKAASEALE